MPKKIRNKIAKRFHICKFPFCYFDFFHNRRNGFQLTFTQNFCDRFLIQIEIHKTSLIKITAIFNLVSVFYPTQGITFPSMYVLISDWIPPRERNKLAVFIWSGVQFGTFLELPISGYLSSWLGWESVFYFNGICGIIWCIFYFLLTSNRPSMSNSISTVSLLYLRISSFEKKYTKSLSELMILVFNNQLVSSAFALLFTEISVVWVTEISVVSLQKFL